MLRSYLRVYSVHARLTKKHSHRIVIAEGIYLLLNEPVWRDLSAEFDECLFIDVDLDIAMCECTSFDADLTRERVVRRHMAAWSTTFYGLILVTEYGADWDRQRAEERVKGNDRPNAEYILSHVVKSANGAQVRMCHSLPDPSLK